MMTAGDSVFSPPQMAALTWAMGIASVLSFGGSLFGCGCYIAFRHKRTFGLQLVFLLSLNDAASQVWIALQIARSFAKDSDLVRACALRSLCSSLFCSHPPACLHHRATHYASRKATFCLTSCCPVRCGAPQLRTRSSPPSCATSSCTKSPSNCPTLRSSAKACPSCHASSTRCLMRMGRPLPGAGSDPLRPRTAFSNSPHITALFGSALPSACTSTSRSACNCVPSSSLPTGRTPRPAHLKLRPRCRASAVPVPNGSHRRTLRLTATSLGPPQARARRRRGLTLSSLKSRYRLQRLCRTVMG